MTKKHKYLDTINFPSDIKKISQSELKLLADEVREEIIDAVSETGWTSNLSTEITNW